MNGIVVRMRVWLMSVLMCVGVNAEDAKPPNIILIMADDLGWAELGSYGQEKIKTPRLDRLAAEGMRFTQFYAGSAVCAPSRCNLMTGMHGGNAYIRDNGEIKNPEKDRFGGQTPLPADVPTIAKTLKSMGYVTGCFGKWGLGGQGSSGDPLKQGFDRFYGYNCQRNAHNLYPLYLENDDKIDVLEGNTQESTGEQYAPQLIADQAVKFVRDNRDKPFFLYYPTVLPHLALQVPDDHLAKYRGQWEETPYKGKSYQPHETPKACYAAMISFIDDQVGRLMDLLVELEIDDSTVVLFTSDNGTTFLKDQVDYEFFNSVGELRGLKGQLYEGGIRVPLIVRWPGKVEGGTTSKLISAHYDIPATLAEIAGGEYVADSDGISMLPTLLGKADQQKEHEFLLWDFAGYGGQLAVRRGNWKIVKRGVRKNPDAKWELYHIKKDIGEAENVAVNFPQIVEELEAIMIRERSVPELAKFRFGFYAEAAEN